MAIRSWAWLAVGAIGSVVLFFGGVLVARILDGAWPGLSRFGGTDEYPELGLSL